MNAPDTDPPMPEPVAAEPAEGEAKPKRRRAPRKVAAASDSDTPAAPAAADVAPSRDAVFAPLA
ncbi:MAG: hypothetical protein Q8M96_22395, partial [Rubrivivax sp.]|nr:hypothetical protein [Rubrivivax sp.]